jgi:hypothetical protein
LVEVEKKVVDLHLKCRIVCRYSRIASTGRSPEEKGMRSTPAL